MLGCYSIVTGTFLSYLSNWEITSLSRSSYDDDDYDDDDEDDDHQGVDFISVSKDKLEKLKSLSFCFIEPTLNDQDL